jgi:hypothetical protein
MEDETKLAQTIYLVKFTCDDADFRTHGASGDLIEFVRGHFKTREGAAACIERTIAEVNDEKDDDETPITQDPENADRWTDGCESYFIETTELLD